MSFHYLTTNMEKNWATLFSFFYLLSFVVFCRGQQENGNQGLQCGKVKLFVFGDSYADTGNSNKMFSMAWKSPYGIDFPGKPSGRFSDGKVFTDYLASFLGIESPMPYAMKKSNPGLNDSGINFAFGGAGVFNTIYQQPKVDVQINYFQQLINQNVIKREDLSCAVAHVSLAGNDYATYLVASGGNIQGLPKFTKSVVDELITNVRRINALGIKKMTITGVPPNGCLPRCTVNNLYKSCDESISKSSQLHNTILNQNLRALNKAGGVNAFVYVDLYNAFTSVLTQGGPLTNKFKPCCIGPKGEQCAVQMGYVMCTDPSLAFFWDAEHPSQAGWQAVNSYLENTSLKALL